jgi:hypothetical protein
MNPKNKYSGIVDLCLLEMIETKTNSPWSFPQKIIPPSFFEHYFEVQGNLQEEEG